MSTASISYLQLDANNDPIFANGTSLVGAEAVGQALLTRLNLFLGEWWENLRLGLPVFQVILGQLGSPRGLAAMTQAVQVVAEGTPYVTQITKNDLNFVNGVLTFTIIAQTVFGPVTVVSNQPGQSASITT